MGFFQESTLISEASDSRTTPRCQQCKLKDYCQSPKLSVFGEGKRSILIIMDHPTESDDASGRWLKGKSGAWLQSSFVDHDVRLSRDCWVTGSFVCHPSKAVKTRPLDASRHCRPLLKQTLDSLDPSHVICVGDTAIQSMMSICYTSEISTASIFYGWTVPAQVGNRWVSCMQHPKLLEDTKRFSTIELHLSNHLARFLDSSRDDRPWQTVPDWQKEIELLVRPKEIKAALRDLRRANKLSAFDYETNMLKPDGSDALILSASVATEDWCIAFPMLPSIVDEWKLWLRSPCRKTACNIKFEDRWSRRIFGVRPRNWYWCSMQAAHIIQSAPVEFTSLKMQALLLLGQPRYNKKIETLLEANGTRKPNRAAEEIAIPDLLKYNGMDTFLELRVGIKQRDLLRYDQ